MSTPVPYEVWDVFTDRAFGGNPLAVIADARGLSSLQMQSIAREFNFSESTFVLPPETPQGTARVRIFTPTNEIPFAGHPTVGTAIALATAGTAFGKPLGNTLVLEEGVGPIPCKVARVDTGWQASFLTEAPFERLAKVDTATVAACLSLTPDEIRVSAHQPCLASKGLPFVIVELHNIAALDRAMPDTSAFRAGEARYPNPADLFAVAAYVRSGADQIEMRMFAPLSNIPEDPATGSAAAALAALLCDLDATPVTLVISQGVAMGRPSTILAQALRTDTGTSQVAISGSAIRTMTGQLHLPT